MFKHLVISLLFLTSLTQAFECEFGCPDNAECVGEEKCACKYGYHSIISEFDGLPHCQWQGTTPKPTKATKDHDFKRKLAEWRVFNVGLEETTVATIFDIEETSTTTDTSQDLEGVKYSTAIQSTEIKNIARPEWKVFNVGLEDVVETTLATRLAIEETLETIDTSEDLEAASVRPEISQIENVEPNNISNEVFEETTLNDISTTNTIIYKEEQFDSTIEMGTTSRSILENTTTKADNSTLGKAAVSKFYQYLGIFCMLVAILFLKTVLFGCVKL